MLASTVPGCGPCGIPAGCTANELLSTARRVVRWTDCALAVGRVLEQLAVHVAVAPRRLEPRRAFHRAHALHVASRDEPVGRSARNHTVAAPAIRDRPEDRPECSAPFVN